MESQLHHTHGHQAHHHHEQEPHHAGLHPEGEDEDHLEKKSVLKKVKAKAKKIKNTLTGHGHEHGHEHDEYDEEDEDDEMVEDQEIHGAPIYESAAVGNAVRGPESDTGQPRGNLGGLMAKEAHHLPEDKHVPFRPANYDVGIQNPTAINVHGRRVGPETGKVGNAITAIEGNPGPTGTNIIGHDENMRGDMGRIGTHTGMEEDPHGPRVGGAASNTQAKATDPTGRGSEQATGITPVLHSFDKMGIYDNPEQKPKAEVGDKPLYSGSHDQFTPEPIRHDNPDSVPKSYDPNNPQDLPRDTLTGNPSNKSGTYTEKITAATSAATSAIADTAKSAKNFVVSKLGYGGNESAGATHEEMHEQGDATKPVASHEEMHGQGDTTKSGAPHEEMHGQGDTTKPASATGAATDYAHKIAGAVAGTLAPVYGKVAGAGSTVLSKVQGSTGTGSTQGSVESERQPDKGVSTQGYNWAEKLRPSEEDKALSEVITGTLSKQKAETEKKATKEKHTGGEGRGITGLISDALDKREPEESGDGKPMGKVTESKEVAKRLGTGEEHEVTEGTGGVAGNVGGGVVGRVKGVFGSWLGGRSGETETSPGTTYAGGNEDVGKDEQGQDGGGERRASGVE